MKSRQSGIEPFARGFFILAAAAAAAFLTPTATYSADRNDEYLISLPDKKASSTKPKITTEKKEPATRTQPAESAKPISRQSLLSGKGSSSAPDPASTAEPAKNNSSRGGLLRGPGGGRRNDADVVEDDAPVETAAEERDPNLTKTVSTWSEGTTDYQTITEYEGDTVVETEIITEHIRGMIVETTTVTETRSGKVVRRSKNKTTRKEESASASTDKQTKSILGRAQESGRNDSDASAAGSGASKPAATSNTTKTQTSGKTTATAPKTASAGNTAKKPTTEKETTAAPPVEEKEETPAEPEPVKESEEEVVAFDPIIEPESAGESDTGSLPDAETKKPDYSDQKSSGTVANPFGTARPSGK